jgi:hypothetical protein
MECHRGQRLSTDDRARENQGRRQSIFDPFVSSAVKARAKRDGGGSSEEQFVMTKRIPASTGVEYDNRGYRRKQLERGKRMADLFAEAISEHAATLPLRRPRSASTDPTASACSCQIRTRAWSAGDDGCYRRPAICAAYCKAIDAGEDSSVVGWLSAINDVQRHHGRLSAEAG